MRFTISSEQNQFFLQNHFIEFDDLLSESDIKEIKEGAQKILANRLKTTPDKLNQFSNTERYMAGRDLWRENNLIKKALFRPKLGEIATTFFDEKHLQIGYDQWIQTATSSNSPFDQFLSIEQISCFNHTSGGLILNLGASPEVAKSYVFCPIPKKIGSGLFLSPHLLLDWKAIFSTPNLNLLLLVYCPLHFRYTLNTHDPHVHTLKRQGYVFGDIITTTTHPLLYR